MFTRLMCILATALLVTAGLRAADDAAPPRRPGAGNNQAQVLLDHAADLGLTDEQKAKLEEFKKGPMSVLTDEQKTKARGFLPARPGAGGGAARRQPPADTKPADAKPEEKKPDEKKPDEKKPEDK